MTQSDFQELLKLCKEIGGRYIFIEDGKPSFVLMNIEEFKRFFSKREQKLKSISKEELIEKINQEVSAWREAQKENKLDNFLLDEEEKKNQIDEARYYYNIEEKLDLDL